MGSMVYIVGGLTESRYVDTVASSVDLPEKRWTCYGGVSIFIVIIII